MTNRLKELRKSKGYSQTKVVEILEKRGAYRTIRAYRDYENGKQDIPLDVLRALGEIYNCNIDYLLGGSIYTDVDNANISQMTGLSEKAIQNIKKLNKMDFLAQYEDESETSFKYMEALNKILSSKKLGAFLIEFANILEPRYTTPMYETKGKYKPTNGLYLANKDNLDDIAELVITPELMRTFSLESCKKLLEDIANN